MSKPETVLAGLVKLEREATKGVVERRKIRGVGRISVGPEDSPTIATFDQLRGADADLYVEMRNALPALLAVVEAAKNGPCRHTADHDGATCPLCKALAELEKSA